MSAPLLTTKLYIPPLRPNLVPRPRLIERLEEGLRQGRRLSLISAPAGFGKTTLVAEWLYSGAKQVSPLAVAWLSLDEEDNDPIRFFTYLIASLRQIDGSIGRAVQGLLGSPQLPPITSLMTLLLNEITAVSDPFVLVLDDLHLVHTAPVHEALAFLIGHQPPPMHLVISTREDPPLPLPRLRVRGQVTEVREHDLRFTAEEVVAFFTQTMGLSLSPKAIALLESRIEGWVAGLQLAAVALRQDPGDAEAFISDFAGDDRYVMDYLITEVLQRQPEVRRDFLRQTSILDQLTAPLCNALTGRKDSQDVLEQLHGSNLFLIPLDHRREWYRYHRFFAEFLRITLDREEQKQLHRKAAAWYEAHGFVDEAIQHALAYAKVSGDAEDAVRLIGLAAEGALYSGSILTLGGWLDALPDRHVRAHADLAIYKGWVLALSGELDAADSYARAAGTCLHQGQGPSPDMDWARLLTLRAHIALIRRSYPETIELASGALERLPEDEQVWRMSALWALAESQERTGNIAKAVATFNEARRAGYAVDNQIFNVFVEMSLVLALNNNGRRREALEVCEEAVARYTDGAGRLLPTAGPILTRLGLLYYEANLLEQARLYYEKGAALSDQIGLESYISIAYGLAAPTLHALGETEAALAALHRAYQPAVRGESYVDPDWFLGWEANIRLRMGDLPFVQRWAETTGASPNGEPDYLRIDGHVVYARLLLVQGLLEDARRWLDRLDRFTRERGLVRWLLTVRVLQALVAERLGDRPAARDALTQAIEIAAPEGYSRAFLDEDEQVIALLPDVRQVAPAFVDQLLEYAGIPRPRHEVAPRPQPLVEPLSERELEVLRLIAAGYSNRAIAERLVIALGTVKRHINNIYGKLGVGSRTQAIARANALRLLDTA